MINRNISSEIIRLKDKFPIITLTGVRQCGKSTLLKNVFKNYDYVSLEDIDIRNFAKEDPRGFLDNYNHYCIFDEVQRVPELFSYIQTKSDNENIMGKYILSGSNNFTLMQNISQSLAGRTAVLNLAPLSINELKNSDYIEHDVNKLMFNGFYPAIYSRKINPNDYFPSYVTTYIERDVRLLRNIPDSDDFIRFIKILATRSGQVLNYNDLSKSCGLSVPTVRAWISVLKQSYLIFTLEPYYNNYSKRLIKSPKIYFYDTGLLCYLLGLESSEQLAANDGIRGAVFETMIVSDYIKSRLFKGQKPQGYYWRDSNQNEIDLIIEECLDIKGYEIKSGSSMERKYLAGLKKFSDISGISMENMSVIYNGTKSFISSKGSYIKFDEAFV